MYFQRDYVLRMIEMMGELMRRICSIASEIDALSELDEISKRACGMPLSMLRTADKGTVLEMLDESQRFLAAQLLLIDIEIAKRKQVHEELLPVRAQALMVLSTIREPDYLLPACDKASLLLQGTLQDLPAQALLDAADLLEAGGQFAASEDALFAAIEKSPDATERALAFYDRLEQKTEAELRLGGLSFAEIAEGRAELKR